MVRRGLSILNIDIVWRDISIIMLNLVSNQLIVIHSTYHSCLTGRRSLHKKGCVLTFPHALYAAGYMHEAPLSKLIDKCKPSHWLIISTGTLEAWQSSVAEYPKCIDTNLCVILIIYTGIRERDC